MRAGKLSQAGPSARFGLEGDQRRHRTIEWPIRSMTSWAPWYSGQRALFVDLSQGMGTLYLPSKALYKLGFNFA